MTFSGKKILVTGHNGFIGSNLIQMLDENNADIITLTDSNGQKIDVRDWNNIKEIESPDIIYHLAAVSYIPYSYENPRETYEVNVLGTLNVLELARLSGTDKVIFTSSYVYGIPKYLPINEKHPLNPNNPYSRSKLIAEKLFRSYYEDFGVRSIIFRPFNIYGIGQRDDFLIPTICNQLETGKIELKDPEPKRDFLYVSDFVRALILAGKYNCDFEIFNLGYGKSYSVKEIVDNIINIYKNPVEVRFEDERRKNEVIETVADISKIKKKLNWEPLFSLDDGLNQIIKNFHDKHE